MDHTYRQWFVKLTHQEHIDIAVIYNHLCIVCVHISCRNTAATVHIEGSDVCTLCHTCSRGYTDVTKYLIMEKKIYDILGTCMVTHCLISNLARYPHLRYVKI